MSKEKILIVEDDKRYGEFIGDALKEENYEVKITTSSKDALKKIKEENFDLIITDLKMGEISGIELLEEVKNMNPDTEVIIITGYATIETAVDALKKGAYDYLVKPINLEELIIKVRKNFQDKDLKKEISFYKEETKQKFKSLHILSKNPKMKEIYSIVERIAPTDTTVLILGETGTGKELLAKDIHYKSSRKDKPFLVVNCSALPETLLESELFGYERGAFTDAKTSKPGKFELANGGTIFLDEIGNIPLSMQIKLLRVLQGKEFERIGGIKTVKVDIRIIAATNIDLRKAIEKGNFREDLFYRLNVITISLPPLRERKEDIPILCEHFLKEYSSSLNKKIKKISEEVMRLFLKYSWPGNIRELENCIERMVILQDGEVITNKYLPTEILSSDLIAITSYEPKSLIEVEIELIKKVLRETNGNVSKSAEMLKISRDTLRYRMKKYNIS